MGTGGGPGTGFAGEVGAEVGAGLQGKVEAGLQARTEVEDGSVLGILGMWRDLGFCGK